MVRLTVRFGDVRLAVTGRKYALATVRFRQRNATGRFPAMNWKSGLTRPGPEATFASCNSGYSVRFSSWAAKIAAMSNDAPSQYPVGSSGHLFKETHLLFEAESLIKRDTQWIERLQKAGTPKSIGTS